MHDDAIEFSPEDAYPARSQRLDDVETVDLGVADFDTVETVVRKGVKVVLRGLSGAAERLWLESLFERIPDAHWRIPLSEIRLTFRSLKVWMGNGQVNAYGVYTPSDKGIWLQRQSQRNLRDFLSRVWSPLAGTHFSGKSRTALSRGR